MGLTLAVALEVGTNISRLEPGSFSYTNRREFAGSHEPIDAAPRDTQDSADVGDREQLLYPAADVLWHLEMCAHERNLAGENSGEIGA
jgi:hypothetical protein